MNNTDSATDVARELAAAIEAVFATEQITTGRENNRMIHLQGRLLVDSEQAFALVTERFRHRGYTPLLRQQDGKTVLVAYPALFSAKPGRDQWAIVLFALTAVSVLFTAAANQAPNLDWVLRHPLSGLPFAAGLLGILVAHELGHFWMARRLGIAASLPYFIPMPLSLFGTMGAVIRVRSPMRSRRQLLAMGAAGPLAGLLIAIPVLVVGLLRSQVGPIPLQEGVFVEGNSAFYALLKFAMFGRFLPSRGYDVFLHPLAFAGWAGLLLTALNLIPAGQLDGGHIAYALFGRYSRWLSRLAVLASIGLGMLWSGWFLWTALLLFLGQRSAEPLDDVTALSGKERALAMGMLLVFALLFTPVPMTFL
jgi:membrane-associated protease RseP (regulator of RpoE activity)